jgi:hypothetical protein
MILIRHLKRKIFLNFEALSNINKYDPTSIYQKSPDILPMLKKSYRFANFDQHFGLYESLRIIFKWCICVVFLSQGVSVSGVCGT